MGIKRVINTDFWLDDKVLDLFSPEDKLFFLYLMTNPHTTQLGIYAINKRVMAFELGYSIESVQVLLDRFETKYNLIKYSPTTGEIAIKNYLRHSIVKGGKPVYDLLIKEISKVKDKSLLQYVYNGIHFDENLNETVKSLLSNLNVNVNDNDNDVSLYESLHESSNESSRSKTSQRFVAPSVSEVKQYIEEKGYHVDAEQFVDFYDSKGWMVGKNKMKDWKASVRTWEKKVKQEQPVQHTPSYDTDYLRQKAQEPIVYKPRGDK